MSCLLLYKKPTNMSTTRCLRERERHALYIYMVQEFGAAAVVIGQISASWRAADCMSKGFLASIASSTSRPNAPNTAPLAGNRPFTFALCIYMPESVASALSRSRLALRTHSSRRRIFHHLTQLLPPSRKTRQEETPAVCAAMAEATSRRFGANWRTC